MKEQTFKDVFTEDLRRGAFTADPVTFLVGYWPLILYTVIKLLGTVTDCIGNWASRVRFGVFSISHDDRVRFSSLCTQKRLLLANSHEI